MVQCQMSWEGWVSSLGSKITGLYYWIELTTPSEKCQVKSVVKVAKYQAAVVVIFSEATL